MPPSREYCKKRWNRGRWVINKLIEAAEVVNNLGENITQIQKLPCNAGQAAALAKSTDTPEHQVKVVRLCLSVLRRRVSTFGRLTRGLRLFRNLLCRILGKFQLPRDYRFRVSVRKPIEHCV